MDGADDFLYTFSVVLGFDLPWSFQEVGSGQLASGVEEIIFLLAHSPPVAEKTPNDA